jgi:hypothetical protein
VNCSTPSELKTTCNSEYADYMVRLNTLWLAARHPDRSAADGKWRGELVIEICGPQLAHSGGCSGGSVPLVSRYSYESSFLHRLMTFVSSIGAPIVQ